MKSQDFHNRRVLLEDGAILKVNGDISGTEEAVFLEKGQRLCSYDLVLGKGEHVVDGSIEVLSLHIEGDAIAMII